MVRRVLAAPAPPRLHDALARALAPSVALAALALGIALGIARVEGPARARGLDALYFDDAAAALIELPGETP